MNYSNKIEIYQSKDGLTQIDIQLKEDTAWLNRDQLSSLFNRDIKTIGKHIGNVFYENKLDKNSTVANFVTVEYKDCKEVTLIL